MVLGGDGGIDGGRLGVTGVDAVCEWGQEAGGSVAEDGGESDLWE